MRKFVAVMMAALFFMACVPPFGGIQTVYGAGANMEALFTTNLIEGTIGNQPSEVLNQRDALPGTVYVEFDLPELMAQEGMIFSYLINANTKAEYTIIRDKIQRMFKVYFDVYDFDGTSWVLSNNNGMNIYAFSAGYIPAATYMSSYNGNVNPDMTLNYKNNTDDTDGYFFERIGPGGGASIDFYSRKSHFLINADGTKFKFSTNGIEEGTIYNYYLYDLSTHNTIESLSVWTGINTNTLDYIPLSKGKEGILDATQNDGNTKIINQSDLHPTAPTVLEYGNTTYPGEATGLAIRFDGPVELKLDTGLWSDKPVYGPLTTTDAADYKVDAVFWLYEESGSGGAAVADIQARVDNILGITPTSGLNSNRLNISTGEFSMKPSSDSGARRIPDVSGRPPRYEIRLYGLEDSTLFTQATAEFRITKNTGNQRLQSPGAYYLPPGTAYTFLAYRFVYANGKFLLRAKPYSTPGDYYLVADGTTLERGSDNGTAVDLEIRYGYKRNYYVLFNPGLTNVDHANISNKNAVYTEIYSYTPNYADWDIGSPIDFEVVEYTLRPLTEYGENEQFGAKGILDLKLRWKVAVAEHLKNKVAKDQAAYKVTYILNKSLTAVKEDTESFGRVTLEIYESPVGSGNFLMDYSYTLDEPPYSGNITGGETGLPLPLTEDENYIQFEIELKNLNATRAEIGFDQGKRFYFPNIYFLNVEVDPYLTEKMSQFDSITLDDLTKSQLPPLRDLRLDATKTDKNSFQTYWTMPTGEMWDYIINSALFDEFDFRVNLYISQSESLMTRLAGLNTEEERNNACSGNIYDVDAGLSTDNGATIEFSGDYLAALRNADNILKIKGIELYDAAGKDDFFKKMENGEHITPGSFLTGLDPNQKYYVFVTLEAFNSYTVTVGGVPEIRTVTEESRLSNLLGATTKDDPDIPIGEDKRPPAPTVEVVDVGLDTATLKWNYADFADEDNPDETVYYHIIRSRNRQIDSAYVNKYDDLEDLYNTLHSEMTGTELMFFRTNDTPVSGRYAPEVYNGSGYARANPEDHELLFGDAEILLKDNTLSSNQIYFYYVRTVRQVGDKFLYSVWNYVNCTTSTLAPPMNLRIEQEGNYDPKTEFIFSFDAPLARIDMLGEDFEIEASIRKDSDDYGEPFVLNTSVLKDSESASSLEGHIRLRYKISGLDSGVQYSIRVRMSSLTSKDKSIWSNSDTTRTDIDQGEYDDNKTTDAWMDFYKQMLEKLMKETYWTVQDSKSKFGAVYRPTMFNEVMAQTADGAVALPTGAYEDAYEFTYYIPAAEYTQANSGNKGFILVRKGMEVIISAGTISTETNEDIFTMLDKVGSDNVKDYYVMYSITFSDAGQTVNGQKSISPRVTIDAELVGSRETTRAWDMEIFNLYTSRVNKEAESASVRTRIFNMLQRNDSAADIEKYILDRVEDVRTDLIDSVNRSHKNNTRYSNKVDTFDKSMIIAMMSTAQEQAVAASGFRQQGGGWESIDTFPYKGGKGIYISRTGAYIFAGVVIDIPGIAGQQNSGTTYGIVAKYSLTDFLGSEGNINVNMPATRNMVLSCAARMMGAPRGSDPVTYLKSKGYNVSGAGTESVATTQESLYIVMMVYEVKTGTKVETIRIRNFAQTATITGMDDRYKPSVRAAFELGIYTNSAMQPKGTINIKDLLEMLTAMDARAVL